MLVSFIVVGIDAADMDDRLGAVIGRIFGIVEDRSFKFREDSRHRAEKMPHTECNARMSRIEFVGFDSGLNGPAKKGDSGKVKGKGFFPVRQFHGGFLLFGLQQKKAS